MTTSGQDSDNESFGRAATLRTVCQDLVEDDSFAGAEFSWGDQKLVEAARGSGVSLGVSSTPIAFATSHHLAYLAGWTSVDE